MKRNKIVSTILEIMLSTIALMKHLKNPPPPPQKKKKNNNKKNPISAYTCIV